MSKISELSDGGSIQSGDTLIAVRSGGNVKVTYGGTTTANIDGGTIDGTVIGGSSAAAGTFTTISASGEIAANGGVALPDGGQATFGAGDDLKIYHTGSHSYIDENGTGNLYIGSNNGGGVYIQGSGENLATFTDDGAVTLYYDNAEKLATTSTGIDVTGIAVVDGLTSSAAITSTSNSNSLGGTTFTSAISGTTASMSGSIAISGNSNTIGGTTFSSNIDVTGTVTADGLTVDGTSTIATFLRDSGANGSLALTFPAQTTTLTSLSGFKINANSADRFNIASNGSVSLYEDTGTTAKFYWDASAESLGIGQGVFSGTQALNLKGEGIAIKNDKSGSNNNWSLIRNTATASESNISFVSGAGEAMVIDHGGNVGIGTDSPSSLLQLLGSPVATSGALATFRNSDATSSNTSFGGVLFNSVPGTDYSIGKSNVNSVTTLSFRNANTGASYMDIDSSGNVGIGVVPESWTYFSPIQAKRSSFAGSDGQTGVGYNWYFDGAYKYIANDYALAYQQNATSGVHSWSTAASGTADNTISWSESMRIDSSGALNIGVSSAISSATNTANGFTFSPSGGYAWLSVSDTGGIFVQRQNDNNVFSFYRAAANVGSISVTSSATAYNTSSDERLKENITDAPAGNIDDIKVRSFDWKADGSHQDYGMVAQELEAVAPYAVSKGETEDDMWSVDYSKLVPMLIKEIQDLKAEVAALKGAN